MQRRVFEIKDLRDEAERKRLYERIDRLASSDAFDVAEVSIRLQVIHEPARVAKADEAVGKEPEECEAQDQIR
jgi:ABC-type taurine transport system substrate-binding protein